MGIGILVLLGLFTTSFCEDLITQEFVDELKKTVTWEVADPKDNVLRNLKKENFKRMLLNTLPVELLNLYDTNRTINKVDKKAYGEIRNLPEQFSWYNEWRDCIHSGRDQGSECGSCWAFGITNHLSDRFCIWGKDVVLSVQHLLECDRRNKCCEGGVDANAYKFLIEEGIVDEQCRPYDIRCHQCRPTNNCARYKCKDNSIWYSSGREDIRREIFNNGPVQAAFDVYADFSNYKSGVYYHTTGEFLGVHTVEVLGWGRENGMNYWICKNCWGDDWGMGSLFKIRMGDCGIDEHMSSCLPDV